MGGLVAKKRISGISFKCLPKFIPYAQSQFSLSQSKASKQLTLICECNE